jgi:hypothetical protein
MHGRGACQSRIDQGCRRRAVRWQYTGKGKTDSRCAQPQLSLTIKDGEAKGKLGADGESYEVRGQLYEDGEVSVRFKQPESSIFTDDFDGQLANQILSFTARLDTSRKACVYHFAVADKQVAAKAHGLPTISRRLMEGAQHTHRRQIRRQLFRGWSCLLPRSDGRCPDGQECQWDNVQRFLSPADGAISQKYRSPSGANLEMLGNARSGDLEVVNAVRGCRWKLTPE